MKTTVVKLLSLLLLFFLQYCHAYEIEVAKGLHILARKNKDVSGNSELTKQSSLKSSALLQTIEFRAHGKKFFIDISVNHHLVSGVNLKQVDEPIAVIGERIRVVDEKEESEVIVEKPSLARFILRKKDENIIQVEGGFQYEDFFYKLTSSDNIFIRPNTLEEKDKLLVARKSIHKLQENEQGNTYKCGTDNLKFNKKFKGHDYGMKEIHPSGTRKENICKNNNSSALKSIKKNNDLDRVLSEGCPVKTHQLTVAVVADCNYVKTFKTKKKARDNILNDLNLVSGIFTKSYNIDLSVSSVELLEKCDSGDSFNVPCKDYPGLDVALNRFSKWRDGRSTDAGIYHLVTACNYSETVGLAWINQVCRTTAFIDSQADTISGTSMSVLVDNQFSVMAHEMSHNLGAIHDCDSKTCGKSCENLLECQCCPCDDCDCKGRFIMDPQNGGVGALEFSTCTVKDICDKIPYLGSCIKEQPDPSKDLTSVCGNGIKEGMEECDCGTPEQCANSKCCTQDCKLKEEAKCADENESCCRDCNIISASAKEVCRVSNSLCMEDTVCDGTSSKCPDSKNKEDGTVCSLDGKCASGVCTSRNLQCSIFGRHLNVTQSCLYTKRSCSVICQGPEQCLDLNANYIDGTPCGNRGYCYRGMCSEFGSDAGKDYRISWPLLLVKTIATAGSLLLSLLL